MNGHVALLFYLHDAEHNCLALFFFFCKLFYIYKYPHILSLDILNVCKNNTLFIKFLIKINR